MSDCRFTGLITTVAVPDSLVFSVEVAVIVTDVGPVTTGAVKVPAELMEPALAVQVTELVKVPVPVTVAKHVSSWPDWMVDGKQLVVTPVTLDGFALEPQAASQSTLPMTRKNPNLRIPLVSVMEVAACVVASRRSITGTRFGKLTNPLILALSSPNFLTPRVCHRRL